MEETLNNVTNTASEEMANKTLDMATNVASMAKIISLFISSKTEDIEAKNKINTILNTMSD